MKRLKSQKARTVLIAESAYGKINITEAALSDIVCEKSERLGAKSVRVAVTDDGEGFFIDVRFAVYGRMDESAVRNALEREIPDMLSKLGIHISGLRMEAERRKNVFQT